MTIFSSSYDGIFLAIVIQVLEELVPTNNLSDYKSKISGYDTEKCIDYEIVGHIYLTNLILKITGFTLFSILSHSSSSLSSNQ